MNTIIVISLLFFLLTTTAMFIINQRLIQQLNKSNNEINNKLSEMDNRTQQNQINISDKLIANIYLILLRSIIHLA